MNKYFNLEINEWIHVEMVFLLPNVFIYYLFNDSFPHLFIYLSSIISFTDKNLKMGAPAKY